MLGAEESFSIFKIAQANNLHNEIFCLLERASHYVPFFPIFWQNRDPSLISRHQSPLTGSRFGHWWILWESFPHYFPAPVLEYKNTKLMKHRTTLELIMCHKALNVIKFRYLFKPCVKKYQRCCFIQNVLTLVSKILQLLQFFCLCPCMECVSWWKGLLKGGENHLFVCHSYSIQVVRLQSQPSTNPTTTIVHWPAISKIKTCTSEELQVVELYTPSHNSQI